MLENDAHRDPEAETPAVRGGTVIEMLKVSEFAGGSRMSASSTVGRWGQYKDCTGWWPQSLSPKVADEKL